MSTHDEFAESFIWDVLESALDPSQFPYLDPWLGEVISPAIQNANIDWQPQSDRSRLAGTATSVLLDLPLIRNCSLHEVLEVREELEEYLLPFRKAIFQLSKKIASDSWESGFRSEVDALIRFEVRPAVEAIERALAESSYVRHLYKRLIDSPPALTKSGYFAAAASEIWGRMSIAIGQSSEAAVSTALCAALSVGTSALTAANDISLSRREISKDQFYFLYAASRPR
jgi:hypothetical protein